MNRMNRKNVAVNKPSYKPSVAQQIMNTIKDAGYLKIDEWKASNFVSGGSSLRFDTKCNFTGEVVIALNVKNNKYMVTFNTYFNRKKKREKSFTDLDLSDIINVIDTFIKGDR